MLKTICRIPFLIPVVVLSFATLGFANEHDKIRQPILTPQNSGTTQLLDTVSVVNSRVVWAAGFGGTYLLTTDGGTTWKAAVVPGAEELQFRDVQGFSDKVAYLQSVGSSPTDFRIYKTVDGGAAWTMQFQNQNPYAFYDGFAFWSPKGGIAHSDSVNGVFPDLRTTDGKTWQDISSNMPPALVGEFSFAAGGTCIATQGERNAWIATGGSFVARILATRDGGDTWNAYDTPLLSSPSAGAFTVAFRDPWNGIVGGGDLDPSDPNHAATATSDDGGKTWTLTNYPPVTGAIYNLSYVRRIGRGQDEERDDDYSHTVVVAALTSAAWTPDEGETWYSLPGVTGYISVAFASPDAGWLVGLNGTILKISFRREESH